MALSDVSYFGIRHHGPGSADSLVQALQELKPVAVLIEGPADASPLLPLLARPEMQPPVALLCYPEDDPASTSFWPFAEFSPEYQATLWAVANNAAVRFIDLPSSARTAPIEAVGETESDGTEANVEADLAPHLRDPIGTLAQAAGYEDGESWWSDIIEQNPQPGPIFAAIADAMTTLRDGEGPLAAFEAKREAHMRLEIAAARKEFDGPIAIVCGAFHVPALQATRPLKEDQALLKGLARRKSMMTWAPWTGPRLALGFGYGAGVVAPGWCKHLWQTRGQGDSSVLWLAKIAAVLRAKGHMVSTASLIEAERLARTLAVIRERPKPGFEELRDAAIAALFNGEALLWALVEAELLLGADVGEIPPDTPLAPLIEDLQRNQKAARLKPEALEHELSVDLRSESGLFRSTLLHRLSVLGVHWGKLTDSGRSRGTFRERWTLSWEPEYAVRLVENLVYGPTIEKAANGRLIQMIGAATSLDAMAALVQGAITANLSEASIAGLAALEDRAARSSECLEILTSVPPLADIIRYGEARKTETARLSGLLERLIVEGGIALAYAARDLDAQASTTLVGAMRKADEAISLVEPEQDVLDAWRNGLAAVLDGSHDGAGGRLCRASALRSRPSVSRRGNRSDRTTSVSRNAGHRGCRVLRGFLQHCRPTADLRRGPARCGGCLARIPRRRRLHCASAVAAPGLFASGLDGAAAVDRSGARPRRTPACRTDADSGWRRSVAPPS